MTVRTHTLERRCGLLPARPDDFFFYLPCGVHDGSGMIGQARVQAQLDAKKAAKAEEVAAQRAAAEQRIQARLAEKGSRRGVKQAVVCSEGDNLPHKRTVRLLINFALLRVRRGSLRLKFDSHDDTVSRKHAARNAT